MMLENLSIKGKNFQPAFCVYLHVEEKILSKKLI